MKKARKLMVLMMICMVLCGVNAGIETCGQIGKDTIGVLSYTQDLE